MKLSGWGKNIVRKCKVARLKINLELVIPILNAPYSAAMISPIIIAPTSSVKLLPEPDLLYKAAELAPVAFTVPEMVVVLRLSPAWFIMPSAALPVVTILPETVVVLELP